MTVLFNLKLSMKLKLKMLYIQATSITYHIIITVTMKAVLFFQYVKEN